MLSRGRLSALVLLATTSALALTACGSADSSATPSTATRDAGVSADSVALTFQLDGTTDTIVGSVAGGLRTCDDRFVTVTTSWETRDMPSAVTLIRSASLSDAAEYAFAATAPAETRLTFLASSCPLNADGSTAGVGDYAAQAASCVENMIVALREAGATITDVISTRALAA